MQERPISASGSRTSPALDPHYYNQKHWSFEPDRGRTSHGHEWKRIFFLLCSLSSGIEKVTSSIHVRIKSVRGRECRISRVLSHADFARTLLSLSHLFRRRAQRSLSLRLPGEIALSIAILPISENTLECVPTHSKTSPRACAVKPALESPRSYGDRQLSCPIQSNKWQSITLLRAL